MKLSEFDYHLPKESIAQYPARERDSSRLLILDRKNRGIKHRVFKNIVEYLHAGDVLVINDAKVIPARIYGKKPTGGQVEVLLTKEYHPNKWEVIVKGLQQGTVIFENGVTGHVSRNNGTVTLTSDNNIREMLSKIGVMPLPPYIKRPVNQLDARQYQTVYAAKEGAIAAPTAGLHFTDELLEKINEKGIEVRKLTLYVGYGTFKPVYHADIENHHMDEEYYEILEYTADAVSRAKSGGRRVIAVGTTVTRALEAAAEKLPPFVSPLGKGGHKRVIKAGVGKTSIFIYPGYKFRVIDALITNFHLPKSTPLMLTSASTGIDFLKKAYLEALNRGYRFFSYGDAMLIV